MPDERDRDRRPGTVAYILKGYPRLSEIFIASEILRVEEAGIPLRLLVLKAADEAIEHEVVRRIQARPEYVTKADTTSGRFLLPYLASNLPRFVAALARVARRRPRGFTQSMVAALAQAWRSRPTRWSAPRKTFLKDWLQAMAVADLLLSDATVTHIHAHFAHGSTTVAWLASTAAGIPFSFTGHAKDIYAPKLNPAGLLRRKLVAAEFAVTCTETNREHLAGIAPGADIRRIYHGLNADFTRLLATAAPLADRGRVPLRVLSVGRLVPKKGMDVLVDAVAIVADKQVDIELVVAGEDGSETAALREQVAARGLEGRVQFVGPLRQDQLLAQYRAASLFCLACRVVDDGDRDGIPNVLVEAMATGLPIVTTPVSGIPEVVRDGDNGVLVPSEDAVALAGAILRLHDDLEFAGRIGERGRVDVLARFDGDVLARELICRFTRAER